jgi:hypothetical protein
MGYLLLRNVVDDLLVLFEVVVVDSYAPACCLLVPLLVRYTDKVLTIHMYILYPLLFFILFMMFIISSLVKPSLYIL